MIESPEAEAIPSSAEPARPTGPRKLGRRLSAPLVLLLGLLVFLTAVGIDSLQQAAAADLPRQPLATLQSAPRPTPPRLVATSQLPAVAKEATGTYLEFDEATAQRLGHSDLLGSHLTRSRLTSSHLLLRNTP